MKILVTGCYGFIGSHFVKHISGNSDVDIIGFARLSDSKNILRLLDYQKSVRMIHGDLTGDISGLLEGVDVVVNFAAKTFVDHSIKDPSPFICSNILGTRNLLEQARLYKPNLFVQISTDEVYGSCHEGYFKEDAALDPKNPYSATKASADMLVISYGNTYKIPYLITRTENNYGSYQHPQKVFPNFVRMALADKPLPIYGDGKHRRMWLRVEDHCSAIWHLIKKDIQGICHIGAKQELENIELAEMILGALKKPMDMIEYIDDSIIRPGHDRRYALDTSRLESTGWKPRYSLLDSISETVEWYKSNQWWLC